ncbi:whirlin-like [Microcaecilia unicolor]|uniref:Whirlin-like n=1 Tax=Microcaecilia unicolor TaxID=1415580 RepID=A0A6P7YCM3_9AMPH|nr:whirlin-like [Microcaecilia unicolor]
MEQNSHGDLAEEGAAHIFADEATKEAEDGDGRKKQRQALKHLPISALNEMPVTLVKGDLGSREHVSCSSTSTCTLAALLCVPLSPGNRSSLQERHFFKAADKGLKLSKARNIATEGGNTGSLSAAAAAAAAGGAGRLLSANVRKLHNALNLLLSELEREQFIHCLNVYHSRRNVYDLVQTLKVILNSPDKRQLLPMLRLVIPRSDQLLFEQYTSEGLYLKGTAPTASPRALEGLRGEIRQVILKRNKMNEGLGFSIRGGSEHGVGIYVSLVEPGSLADKEGLRIGDQIVRVNNKPLDSVTHGEAVKVRNSTLVFHLFKDEFQENKDEFQENKSNRKMGLLSGIRLRVHL